MPKLKLTPDLEAKILASIRAGSFPHVAAEAWGVPRETFDNWLKLGSEKSIRKPYSSFYKNVRQAVATARLKAEMEAYQANPITWLKSGPGKEKPDEPGWTSVIRPQIINESKTINLFTSPDFLQFMATLRSVLAPYPSALKALADAMDGKPPEPAPLPAPPAPINIQPSEN